MHGSKPRVVPLQIFVIDNFSVLFRVPSTSKILTISFRCYLLNPSLYLAVCSVQIEAKRLSELNLLLQNCIPEIPLSFKFIFETWNNSKDALLSACVPRGSLYTWLRNTGLENSCWMAGFALRAWKSLPSFQFSRFQATMFRSIKSTNQNNSQKNKQKNVNIWLCN